MADPATPVPTPSAAPVSLRRFAWLSIAAAVATIALKTGAWQITGSVGLLSDALESLVNLVAGIAALIAITVAERAPDEEHAYGHTKAEYFSSGLEGLLVLIAAGAIAWTSVTRLLDPVPLEQVGWGLLVSTSASIVNGAVAWRLFRVAAAHRSVTLRANARHLLTDVWTSAGVLLAVAAVAITGWTRMDPVIALIVGANIARVGVRLVGQSAHGLLDTALPEPEAARITAVLDRYIANHGIRTHALRTRDAGTRQFMSVHVLVPGDWSVRQGHELLEALERDLRAELPGLTVFTHLEPIEDPESWADITLDRGAP